jgi:hypothetical protein
MGLISRAGPCGSLPAGPPLSPPMSHAACAPAICHPPPAVPGRCRPPPPPIHHFATRPVRQGPFFLRPRPDPLAFSPMPPHPLKGHCRHPWKAFSRAASPTQITPARLPPSPLTSCLKPVIEGTSPPPKSKPPSPFLLPFMVRSANARPFFRIDTITSPLSSPWCSRASPSPPQLPRAPPP